MAYKILSHSLVEQEALEFHNKYFGKHTFRISTVEEYIRLKPIMSMLGRNKVKVVFLKGLTEDKIKKAIRAEYDKRKYWEDRKPKPEKKEKVVVPVNNIKPHSKKGYIYSGVKIISGKSVRAFRNHKPTMYRK